MTVADLRAEALAIRDLGAAVVSTTDIGVYPVELGIKHWRTHPLDGKEALLPNWQHHATDNVETIIKWWGGRYRGANIGAIVPENLIVVDTDDLAALAELERQNSEISETLTVISGRAAGGRHIYLRRPPGKLTASRLPKGVELRWSPRYCVMPKSVHPDTGQRYQWVDPNTRVADPPPWLVDLIVVRPQLTTPSVRSSQSWNAPSIADQFSANTSWSDILMPHGWACLDADPDADRARWLHPKATSACSATIKNSCLFVYSPNTPFDVTEPGNPKGYTRFRAHAVLNHGGDMSAAAKALKEVA